MRFLTFICFSQGANAELTLKGNLSAKFSPASNKLISLMLNFDTGMVGSQMNHILKYPRLGLEDVDDADAAQVAASEADAILDSLQMPHIATTTVPSNVTVVPADATDGEKSVSSDDSHGEAEDDKVLTTRRGLRVRKD